MISILPLVLLLGVASPKHISYYDNIPSDAPIITRSQERRICAELCMSGLGGDPCGRDCSDMTPQGMPRKRSDQFENASAAVDSSVVTPRESVCPVLCANHLGYPLCKCNDSVVVESAALWQQQPSFFRVDFTQICVQFCLIYNYQMYGCDLCDNYRNDTGLLINGLPFGKGGEGSGGGAAEPTKEVDWNAWCQKMCSEGEGGAACYCDLLPMSLIN